MTGTGRKFKPMVRPQKRGKAGIESNCLLLAAMPEGGKLPNVELLRTAFLERAPAIPSPGGEGQDEGWLKTQN